MSAEVDILRDMLGDPHNWCNCPDCADDKFRHAILDRLEAADAIVSHILRVFDSPLLNAQMDPSEFLQTLLRITGTPLGYVGC